METYRGMTYPEAKKLWDSHYKKHCTEPDLCINRYVDMKDEKCKIRGYCNGDGEFRELTWRDFIDYIKDECPEFKLGPETEEENKGNYDDIPVSTDIDTAWKNFIQRECNKQCSSNDCAAYNFCDEDGHYFKNEGPIANNFLIKKGYLKIPDD